MPFKEISKSYGYFLQTMKLSLQSIETTNPMCFNTRSGTSDTLYRLGKFGFACGCTILGNLVIAPKNLHIAHNPFLRSQHCLMCV